jgi:hypothetical protein
MHLVVPLTTGSGDRLLQLMGEGALPHFPFLLAVTRMDECAGQLCRRVAECARRSSIACILRQRRSRR